MIATISEIAAIAEKKESDPAEGKQASLPVHSESYRAVLPRKKDCSSALHHYT